MSSQIKRINTTRRQRAMVAYVSAGNDGGFAFALCGLSILACIILFFAAFGTGNFYLIGIGVAVASFFLTLTMRAAIVEQNILIPSNHSYSRDATSIYNRLNDTYKIAAKPMVLKVYEIENHIHKHRDGLRYNDPEAIAIKERITALTSLESKQRSEIARPMIDDKSDMIGAELTLNADYLDGIRS